MCRLYSKLYIVILLAVFSVSCYADEIYGIGISKDIQEADLMAIENLSKSIKSEVSCKERLEVEVYNGKKNEKYVRNVSSSTNLIIRYSKQEVKFEKGKYIVKRYFNKEEYSIACMKSYDFYINEAADAFDSEYRNHYNIALGNYYKAYLSINDDVFIACNDKAYEMMDYAKNKAMEIYNLFFDISISGCPEKHFTKEGEHIHVSGNTRDINGNPKELYDFEYFDGVSWCTPKIFYSKNCIHYIGNEKISCLIKNCGKIIEYRPLYEILVGDKPCKINVSEDWHFSAKKIFFF